MPPIGWPPAINQSLPVSGREGNGHDCFALPRGTGVDSSSPRGPKVGPIDQYCCSSRLAVAFVGVVVVADNT